MYQEVVMEAGAVEVAGSVVAADGVAEDGREAVALPVEVLVASAAADSAEVVPVESGEVKYVKEKLSS